LSIEVHNDAGLQLKRKFGNVRRPMTPTLP
jgi:hypothetical protein